MSFEPKPASSIAPQNEANPRMDKGQDNDNEALYTPLSVSELWAMRLPQPYVIPLCGGIAGAVAGIVSCPLDVIKTKLQAQGGFRLSKETPKLTTAAYRGVYGTARMIWTEEGLRGLYRGLGPMLLGYVPTWAVYLTVYNKTQAYFRTKTGIVTSPGSGVQILTTMGRQLVPRQRLCVFEWRHLLYVSDEPDLGDQDTPHVSSCARSIQQTLTPPLAIPQHARCSPQNVSQRRHPLLLFRAYTSLTGPNTRSNTVSFV